LLFAVVAVLRAYWVAAGPEVLEYALVIYDVSNHIAKKTKLLRRLRMRSAVVSRVRAFLGSDSEGSALVELGVTLPLVLLVMSGICGFSLLLYQKLQLAEAVANCGRYLAVARGNHDPCADAVNAVYAAAPSISPSSLTINLSQNGTALPASCPGPGTSGPSTTLVQGSTATVQVYYATSLFVYGSSFGNMTMASQISEVVQ
jgi:Flp pilus assembly protein TadG